MDRAEIGFALNPQLWGTGVFIKAMNLYLDFLFNEWGVKTLVGKTRRAERARRRRDAQARRQGDRALGQERRARIHLDDRDEIRIKN